jgi:hypothetical protein
MLSLFDFLGKRKKEMLMKLFRLSGLALAMLPLCLIGVEGVEAAPVDSAVVQKAPYLQTIRWDAEFDVVVAGYGFAGGSAAIAGCGRQGSAS